MTNLTRLDPIERDHFTEIVESSMRVTERRLFFGWTQGIVQTLLPHEILICGASDGGVDSTNLGYFSGSRYFRDEHFNVACARHTGVVARLIAEWQTSGGVPCVIARQLALNGHAAHADELEQVELRNIALHGILAPGRRVLGIYAISRIPADCASLRLSYLLELLTPCIHTTFVRVLVKEAQSAPANGRPANRQVTPREAEILRWIKEGKTNSDIAGILDLSPWTVKNHVQTILKKLQAQTRSHAVARAMSMGILDTSDG